MTKEAVLHAFFNSFGIPGYTVAGVPEDAQYPWLTYELATGSFDSGDVPITVNLWYYTTDEAAPNAKAREIAERIGLGGVSLRCDGGGIIIKRGNPFSQSLTDDDVRVKRRYIQVLADFITAN